MKESDFRTFAVYLSQENRELNRTVALEFNISNCGYN